ncbi:MAG: hypothetical protein ACRCTU_11810 [Zoogloea sp.]|uniref:hypothetical protein n=1 Tax=Zoogloea sp. TaxID=49181 RepID=UPI003F41137B
MESDSVIYGLLGRIHVLTRRVLNRITDVEYMRVNQDYAREIVRIGQESGNAELGELCQKLTLAMDLDAHHEENSPQRSSHLGLFQKLRHAPAPEESKNRYVHSLR